MKGTEALAIGLADRLTSPDDLRAAVTVALGRGGITDAAPLSVLAIRGPMRGDLATKVQEATNREHEEQQRLRKTDDFREGVAATAERHKPHFTAT